MIEKLASISHRMHSPDKLVGLSNRMQTKWMQETYLCSRPSATIVEARRYAGT